MRRKTRMTSSGRRRAVMYVCALVALFVYGVPRLPALRHGLAGSFSVLWILFAGLAVAANLYFILGADKERSRMLESRRALTPIPSKEAGRRARTRAH